MSHEFDPVIMFPVFVRDWLDGSRHPEGRTMSLGKNRYRHSRNRTRRMAEARKRGTHTKEQWIALRGFFRNECVRCLANGRLTDLANMEPDHIRPIYQGGSDAITNIQPMCARCNCQKGSESIDYRPAAYINLALVDLYEA